MDGFVGKSTILPALCNYSNSIHLPSSNMPNYTFGATPQRKKERKRMGETKQTRQTRKENLQLNEPMILVLGNG